MKQANFKKIVTYLVLQLKILTVAVAYSFLALHGKGPMLVLMLNILRLLHTGLYFTKLCSSNWILLSEILVNNSTSNQYSKNNRYSPSTWDWGKLESGVGTRLKLFLSIYQTYQMKEYKAIDNLYAFTMMVFRESLFNYNCTK